MELRVHKVLLTASGGSHVTVYDAEVELVPGSAGVHVCGAEPPDAWPGQYQQATEAIRKGAEQVLGPSGMGAVIRVTRIVLHPVDFKPHTFERYTVEELRRLMGQRQNEPDAAPDLATGG